jgi:hypothetical protein
LWGRCTNAPQIAAISRGTIASPKNTNHTGFANVAMILAVKFDKARLLGDRAN